jgi:hypothetical protein
VAGGTGLPPTSCVLTSTVVTGGAAGGSWAMPAAGVSPTEDGDGAADGPSPAPAVGLPTALMGTAWGKRQQRHGHVRDDAAGIGWCRGGHAGQGQMG